MLSPCCPARLLPLRGYILCVCVSCRSVPLETSRPGTSTSRPSLCCPARPLMWTLVERGPSELSQLRISSRNNISSYTTSTKKQGTKIYLYLHPACNITTCSVASAIKLGKKQQLGKQNKTLICLARQVLFCAESLQCYSPLFNKVTGQVEVLACWARKL